jgi:ABC-2 type transport system permease protein
MTLIANELTKLRTIRGPWLIAAIQQALIVAGVSGLAVSGIDLSTQDGVRSLLSHAGIASAILSLVLGITAVAGEYRHKTMTDTYLGVPRRGRVVTAKLLTYTAVGVGLGVVGAATGLVVTAAWLAGDGITIDLSDATIWRTVGGIVAINGVYAAIGVSLGALVRNLTAAIVVALVWIAVLETTVANLLSDVGRWLPNRAGMGLDYMPAEMDVLPQWGAGLVLSGYAVLLVVAAMAATVRRDVT